MRGLRNDKHIVFDGCMKRTRCDKGFPRATKEELSMVFANLLLTCSRYGLSEASTSRAWDSARIDHDKAARCYAAIVRSLKEERA